MGNIDILVIVKQKYCDYHVDLAVYILKTVYKCVDLNIAKLVMITANGHDIARLLLLIIILLEVKLQDIDYWKAKNIMIDRQNPSL